jgi:hypothetical protein
VTSVEDTLTAGSGKMPTINDDMERIMQSWKEMTEQDKTPLRRLLVNEDVIYKIMLEKSAQIKSGACPEPYPYNPLPRRWEE